MVNSKNERMVPIFFIIVGGLVINKCNILNFLIKLPMVFLITLKKNCCNLFFGKTINNTAKMLITKFSKSLNSNIFVKQPFLTKKFK